MKELLSSTSRVTSALFIFCILQTSVISTVAMAIESPYGTWKTPITSKAITAGSISLSSLCIHNNNLLWLEGRPQEKGRYVVCKVPCSDLTENLSDGKKRRVDITPKSSNCRTRVHEYGGDSFCAVNEDLYYSEFTTQHLMKIPIEKNEATEEEEEPGQISPSDKQYRFANAVYSPTHNALFAVREDHTGNPSPKDVVNEIVKIDLSTKEIQVIATGNDFYSSPKVSPNGEQLAYITWNHPNMPWDATELRVCDLLSDSSEDTKDHKLIAGQDGDTSVIQPLYHPESGKLFYISDEAGYYDIYCEGKNVLQRKSDFGGSAPGWVFGQEGFIFLADGRLVATYSKEGETILVVASVDNKDGSLLTDVKEYSNSKQENDILPMSFGGIVCSDSNELFFLGGSASTPTSIYKFNLDSPTDPALQLICSSSSKFSSDYISTPKQIEFETTGGKTAFGYYYPPLNKDYICAKGEEAPPLLVKAHGGPTACARTTFNPAIQYWTSRGFAILDVDYGGSTGYGRDYRRRLRGSWGIVDIDDVCNGAEHLVKEKLADPKRLCIDGGSAGGFTTLGALAFKNVFTAGTSLYGVADLSALAGDTHKFESRYLDGLVGPYPSDLYTERSPINSVDTLNCPILLLQGDEDKIVPPNQAEMMFDALKSKGIPTCLKMYEGEQHGFRKAENIEDALDSELAFYRKVYGIVTEEDDGVDLTVENME